jgi:flavin-dependent dehydrogenase
MNAGRMDEEADVVVVGGGPGGSTLATLVAMRGHRVVLLEKEKFPRWQIGESLLPSTVKSSIVKSAMQEGAKERARVLLGEDAGPETPLFDGGLIASPDGLSWSVPEGSR